MSFLTNTPNYPQKKTQPNTGKETITNMSKQLQIRNSTAEFLIFQAEDKAQGVQVFYKDETIWATQKAMATLFDCSTDNIGVHLKNIFESGELDKDSVTEKISATAADDAAAAQWWPLDALPKLAFDHETILRDAKRVMNIKD